MATNNMAFDPTKYGAIPFNPTQYGATPVTTQQPTQPEGYQPTFQINPEEGYLTTAAKTVGNIPGSLWQFGKGILNFLNPVNTWNTLKQIPGEWSALVEETGGDATKALGMTLGETPKSTYEMLTPKFIKKVVAGDIEGSLKTITEDPVGQLAPILLLAEQSAKKLGYEKQFNNMIKTITSPIATPITKVLTVPAQWVTRQIQLTPERLETINLRLSPLQKKNLGIKLDNVVDFINKQVGIGTPETRFNKVDKIYQDTEEIIQDFLDEKAKGNYASKSKIIVELTELKKSLMRDSPDATAIDVQIEAAIDNLNNQYKYEKIPVSRLNELKRNTMSNAYNKAGTKVLSGVEFGIGDVLRNNITQAVEGLTINGMNFTDFNKQYSTIITARDLLNNAQYKPQQGLIGRLTSDAVGGALGSRAGPAGTAFGILAGERVGNILGGTYARSLMAKLIQGIGQIKIPSMVGKVVGPISPAITTGGILQKK